MKALAIDITSIPADVRWWLAYREYRTQWDPFMSDEENAERKAAVDARFGIDTDKPITKKNETVRGWLNRMARHDPHNAPPVSYMKLRWPCVYADLHWEDPVTRADGYEYGICCQMQDERAL